jgi:hypothetical protein
LLSWHESKHGCCCCCCCVRNMMKVMVSPRDKKGNYNSNVSFIRPRHVQGFKGFCITATTPISCYYTKHFIYRCRRIASDRCCPSSSMHSPINDLSRLLWHERFPVLLAMAVQVQIQRKCIHQQLHHQQQQKQQHQVLDRRHSKKGTRNELTVTLNDTSISLLSVLPHSNDILQT